MRLLSKIFYLLPGLSVALEWNKLAEHTLRYFCLTRGQFVTLEAWYDEVPDHSLNVYMQRKISEKADNACLYLKWYSFEANLSL